MLTLHRCTLVAVAACAALGSLAAQPSFPLPAQAVTPEWQSMMAAMQSAQTTAIRPGDEALGCDALRTQAVAAANDPSLKAYTQATASIARDPALSIQPDARVKVMRQMQSVMPKMLRLQRLVELGMGRNCAWAVQGLITPVLTLPVPMAPQK